MPKFGARAIPIGGLRVIDIFCWEQQLKGRHGNFDEKSHDVHVCLFQSVDL